MTLHQSISPEQVTAWEKTSELLDILRDDPADVVAFLAHCSADDLHQLTRPHGFAVEVEIFEAILNHPACDRATALQIFDACNPQYYENELIKGCALDSYDDEEDTVFIAIINIAHQRLCSRLDWPGKFHSMALRHWEAYPHTSPITFDHWTLPEAVLTPTEQQPAKPLIAYHYSSIRLTFEAWFRIQ